MNKYFTELEISKFWKNSEYALKNYVSEPYSSEQVKEIEAELGYKLPESYLAFMRIQNGGIPKNTAAPSTKPTSWANDHVEISGIFGIGRDKPYSLGGQFGSRFMIKKWGYPDIGIYLCDCPSTGHDMICLDYRKNGKHGEPQVVHVDQEYGYEITFLAKTFEAFIKGLVRSDYFE